jgi:hypothetical protein
MEVGIHQLLHCVSDVLRGKWSSVGETYVFAQREGNLVSGMVHGPGGGELRLEFLRVAVESDQHAARQIANRLRSIIVNQKGVKGLWLRPDAEPQFASSR